MKIHINDITINIIKPTISSTKDDDDRLLVDYVNVLYEICNNTS